MHEAEAHALIAWFDVAQRPLPWRGPYPRDPYPTLVSEVMLQQTQVDRIVEPYRRFLARFPSLEALAGAAEDEVIGAFSGLGYYRRARLLHAAARAVVAAGAWPDSRAGLADLPGVGDYTSAALAAFAFAGTEPPVDGNVQRVAARFLGLELRLASPELHRAARQLARELHAAVGTPALWEALMELGARVCTPAQPRCDACPLAAWCAAHLQGRAAELPRPRRQRRAESERWVSVWAASASGRVLLRRVPTGALLAGMWLPPFRPLAGDEAAADAAARLLDGRTMVRRPHALGSVRHSITHRRITVELFRVDVVAALREPRDDETWSVPDRPEVPTPSLFGKLRDLAGAGERSEYPDAQET